MTNSLFAIGYPPAREADTPVSIAPLQIRNGYPVHIPQQSARPPSQSKANFITGAVRGITSLCRYTLTCLTLVVPTSVVSVASCLGGGCSAKCDDSSAKTNCSHHATAECPTDSICSVVTACFCSGVSMSNPEPSGCNSAACAASADQAECGAKIGCEWGKSCVRSFDCHTMDLDENACRKHDGDCTYQKDCG